MLVDNNSRRANKIQSSNRPNGVKNNWNNKRSQVHNLALFIALFGLQLAAGKFKISWSLFEFPAQGKKSKASSLICFYDVVVDEATLKPGFLWNVTMTNSSMFMKWL